MIKNNIIGRAQSINGTRSFGTTGVYEIGSIMPHEHVFLKYQGSITLEKYRMIFNNLASSKIGATALGEDILQRDVIDVNVMDTVTKNLCISYRGCSAESYNEDFKANEIVGEQLTMLYLTSTNMSNS